MADISFVKCSVDDVDLLCEIAVKTFSETFDRFNTAQDMRSYLDLEFDKDKLRKELNNQNSSFFFLYYDAEVIGYLKTNDAPSQTDINDVTSLEIERIYVLSKYQGQGLGQYLIDRAIEIALNKNKRYVWLGVWENNAKALRFYKKNGFYKIGEHVFRLGSDDQTDYVMRKDL